MLLSAVAAFVNQQAVNPPFLLGITAAAVLASQSRLCHFAKMKIMEIFDYTLHNIRKQYKYLHGVFI